MKFWEAKISVSVRMFLFLNRMIGFSAGVFAICSLAYYKLGSYSLCAACLLLAILGMWVSKVTVRQMEEKVESEAVA